MGTLINFLLDNFIYVLFIAVLLVLALIGYIVDSSKTTKLRKELTKEEDTLTNEIPIANIDSNIKLGETVNKMATPIQTTVNDTITPKPAVKVEETPKL